jgi:hypothetical protein
MAIAIDGTHQPMIIRSLHKTINPATAIEKVNERRVAG